ncbi:MAG: hypothetical protein JWP25_7996 [Bradyrhizobium sp.]|jgi:hypothetical protein|nr:hypothetical protein [Bradyrhizobium sp.]
MLALFEAGGLLTANQRTLRRKHALVLASCTRVRSRSFATEIDCTRYVRFPPKSDRTADIAACLKRVMNGLMLRSKQRSIGVS